MSAGNLPIEELRQRLLQIPIEARSIAGLDSVHRELIGFVPPCLDGRDTGVMEANLLGMHEQLFSRGLIPPAFDLKSTHLMLLAMVLMQHGVAAAAQGVAARRAGASWDELRAVVGLAFLLQGLPAANRGEELLTEVAEREHAERVAGAVAAYA